MIMSDKDKLHSGEIYDPMDNEIFQEQILCLKKLYDFNQTSPLELDKRNLLLKEMFAEIGDNCYIEPPFHANWGGKQNFPGMEPAGRVL